MSAFLPRQADGITASGERASNPFYLFLQQLDIRAREAASGDALATAVSAIATALGSPDGTIEGIPDRSLTIGLILGQGSIRHFGVLTDGNVFLSLEGDDDAPGATHYYGTDALGVKGWHPVSETIAATANITLTVDPVTGVTTIDLPDLPDAGGGTLLVSRDAKGRVTGTAPDSYVHTQAPAAAQWTINHNLNRRVSVAVYTPGGVERLAEVVSINNNQSQIFFDGLFDGYAVVH